MTNLGRINEKFEQYSNEMRKKDYLDNYRVFEKGKFLTKMVNLTKADQMFGKNSQMS